ncbi:MAG: MmgE/PrpD family protein [Betaproteobacteria bacterium]|nr:MmgE/PrpD family protein [Betaproteobacteria bacterium]
MSLACQLAERITALHYEDLPPEAVYWSGIAVLDTIGVTLAGAVEAPPRILEEVISLDGRNGPSLIFGTNRRATCLDAALVNSTAAHVLDFDNTSNTMFGHVSAAMIPALIAAGEAFGASGRDLLLAHVAGFETATRVAPGLNVHHYEKGWHSTATLGVFAVTAACARLLNLSVPETETALALSTSLAAGTKANFGTMTKSLHVGQCARGGLLAVLLARKGFTANPDAFEHKQGFFNVFNGPGLHDKARALEGWGDPLDIVAPGASYKLYPCCYSTHAAIEAALALVREHGPIDPRAVQRVDSYTHTSRLAHTDRPDPRSALDAKFSVQYCVARALLHGKVVLEHFDADAHHDSVVRALLPRVYAAPYTGKLFLPDDPFDAEVKVTLTDGSTCSAHVDRPLGRTSANPIPLERIREKFENCAGRVLAPDAVSAASRLIESCEDLRSVRDLTALLERAHFDTSSVERALVPSSA